MEPDLFERHPLPWHWQPHNFHAHGGYFVDASGGSVKLGRDGARVADALNSRFAPQPRASDDLADIERRLEDLENARTEEVVRRVIDALAEIATSERFLEPLKRELGDKLHALTAADTKKEGA